MSTKFFAHASLIMISLFAFRVFAGGEAHGGGAFICPKSKNNELVDLWEAKYFEGVPVKRTNAPVNKQIQDAIARLKQMNPLLGAQTQIALNLFWRDGALWETAINFLKPGGSIPYPNDSNHQVVKTGCTGVGAAMYMESEPAPNEVKLPGILLVDPVVVNALPKTDQAALWVHEAMFSAIRTFKYYDETLPGINRFEMRVLVGKLFSTLKVPQLPVPVLCETLDRTESHQTRFAMYVTKDKLLVRPTVVGGSYVFDEDYLFSTNSDLVAMAGYAWKLQTEEVWANLWPTVENLEFPLEGSKNFGPAKAGVGRFQLNQKGNSAIEIPIRAGPIELTCGKNTTTALY